MMMIMKMVMLVTRKQCRLINDDYDKHDDDDDDVDNDDEDEDDGEDNDDMRTERAM